MAEAHEADITRAQALVKAAKEIGLDSMLFIRHANSNPGSGQKRKDDPHDWKVDDQMRTLTQKGWEQCQSASQWFSEIDIRAIMSSPARRAADTAMAMKAQIETEEKGAETLHVGMVDAVHPAGTSEECETLFETLGYGPLRSFFEAQGGQVAFLQYGELAAGRICDHLQGPLMGEMGDRGSCVAVFGHAVFLNAIAYVVSNAAGGAGLETLLDMDLGETQGVLVSLSDGSCKHILA
mmetsp:Transcript_24929/g.56143  ORF Transcript_24929/g.56143 Transcript_24929/m.56143 type:complete len:237 (+) Transcript_24929:91-801(+)